MPWVQNPSLGPGQAPVLTTTTQLSSAQIVTGAGGNLQIIPAPGAGKVIVMFAAMLAYKFGTKPYFATAGDFPQFLYGTTGDPAMGFFNAGGVLVASVDTDHFYPNTIPGPLQNLATDVNNNVTFSMNGYGDGPIATATLGAGGAGYAANDTGTISTGSADATYKVLTVGGGGNVLTFQITAAGTAYATGSGVATATGGAQPGVGVGFTVNITAVTTGDGTAKIVTFYQIVPVP